VGAPLVGAVSDLLSPSFGAAGSLRLALMLSAGLYVWGAGRLFAAAASVGQDAGPAVAWDLAPARPQEASSLVVE